MQNRGICCLKKCFTKETAKGIFMHENLKKNSIVNENALNSERSLMHYKSVLAIICSNSFSHCKGDQKKTVAISQMFNHVQLHVHWMYLLNTRVCRYTCIYITPTVQTLHYCPAGA